MLFRADSVEAFRAQAGRDGALPGEGAGQAWESELASLAGWLGDVGEALAPFDGTAPLPSLLPAGEEVPLEIEEEAEPLKAPAAEPAPVVEVVVPEPQPEPEPSPQPATAAAPQPEAAPIPEPAPVPRPSHQVLLAVQPIHRFAVLRDVGDALRRLTGVSEVRLERLESGVASYRLTFAVERPADEALAGAVAGLGLTLFVVSGG